MPFCEHLPRLLAWSALKNKGEEGCHVVGGVDKQQAVDAPVDGVAHLARAEQSPKLEQYGALCCPHGNCVGYLGEVVHLDMLAV